MRFKWSVASGTCSIREEECFSVRASRFFFKFRVLGHPLSIARSLVNIFVELKHTRLDWIGYRIDRPSSGQLRVYIASAFL